MKKSKKTPKKTEQEPVGNNIFRLYLNAGLVIESPDKKDVFRRAAELNAENELSRIVVYEMSEYEYRIIWKNGVAKPKTPWTPTSFKARRSK